MAASRDRESGSDSVGRYELRPGSDDVHIDISDARFGVRKGCGDWCMDMGAIELFP